MADFDNSVLQREQDRMACLQAENQHFHNQQSQLNAHIFTIGNRGSISS